MYFKFLPLKLFLAIYGIITFYPDVVKSQTLPIQQIQEEQLMLNSLLSDTLVTSASNRPFWHHVYKEQISQQQYNSLNWWERPIINREFKLAAGFRAGIQPLQFRNTFNSRFPNSENNEAAWYGRGNSTELSGGVYLTSDYLTVHVHPQVVYQENKDFLIPNFVRRDSNGNPRYEPANIGPAMDAPFRFGPDPYTTFNLGYSSIRLHYNNFETGLSTEPLWWGPARRYSLVMSNNAPGFTHAFLATRKPVNIPYFGDIQLRWVLGYPKESEWYRGAGRGESRFTNAVNANYSPLFFKNLTVGFTRVYHMYEIDGFDFSNVFRIFDPLSRSRLVSGQGGDDIRQARNQTASFYVHLSLNEARAEIYAEFYREDHSYNLRDFINQPHHNSAYTIGLTKLSNVPFFDFLKTNIEINSLTTSQLRQVRHQSYYYTHSRIRQGHTNRGQILGAAIGPGSNSQYLGFDAYKSNYRFGLFAQRIVENDNFHFIQGSASNALSANFGDYFRHRVNLNFGLNFLYGPGPFYINSRLVWTKAYNYGRFDYGRLDGINATNYDRNDRTNVQFQIGITYIL